jgi:hypothetical protein
MLPQDVVDAVVRHASPENGAFLVGGQALNFWAERYSEKAPELIDYGPFASKDIDFFGNGAAAAKLAKALGGTVNYPSMDNHTPNSAIVTAVVLGHRIHIDFLLDVAGPPADKLAKQMVSIDYPLRSAGQNASVPVGVMHPLHCLQSRASNVITLGRKDRIAQRQLDAAPIVVREYVSEALGQGRDVHRARVASSVLKALGEYLLSDPVGAKIHQRTANNPLAIIQAFEKDERFDERYRQHQLKHMIEEVQARQARDRNRAAFAARSLGLGR